MFRSLVFVVLGIIPPFVTAAKMCVVIARTGSCDYFVADGPRGLYVLELY